MTSQVRKEMLYTPEQWETSETIRQSTNDATHAELIRRLLALEAERLGIAWPDNMPTKKENSRKAVAARTRKPSRKRKEGAS